MVSFERSLRLCQQQSHRKCRKCITSARAAVAGLGVQQHLTPVIIIKDALAIQNEKRISTAYTEELDLLLLGWDMHLALAKKGMQETHTVVI